MAPTPELIRQLRRDKIEAARRMTPEQRLLAGGDLFDAVIARMQAGAGVGVLSATSRGASGDEEASHAHHASDGSQQPLANTVIATAIAALDLLNVPSMLVGSVASNGYRSPQTDYEVDLVVESKGQMHRIFTALGSAFETISARADSAAVIHKLSGLLFEFFELSADPHDQQRFARRRQATLAGRPVSVPTAEDVVITKLRWSKGGARHKDVEDVENVLAVQEGALDLPYIRHWTDQHGTRQLFERLLVAAAEP